MRLSDDSGLSLTELLVVSVLVSVIISASYFMFNAASAMNDMAMARAIASDELQQATGKMAMEIREVRKNNPDKGAFKLTSANEIVFTADVNNDRRPELVRYYVSGGALLRTMALPAQAYSPELEEYTFGAAGAPSILVEKLDTSAGAIFCYHSTTPNSGAVCAGNKKDGFNIVVSTDPYNVDPKISMIGINLRNTVKSGDKTIHANSRVLSRTRSVENQVN